MESKGQDSKTYSSLPVDASAPTRRLSSFTKARRRLQNLEGIWTKHNQPHVQCGAAAQKLWRRARRNPRGHDTEEHLIDKWTNDPPKTNEAIFHIEEAQANRKNKQTHCEILLQALRGEKIRTEPCPRHQGSHLPLSQMNQDR